MKRIKLQVEFSVPKWNFCNNDNGTYRNPIPKETCRFCVRTKTGYQCVLTQSTLLTDGTLINKTDFCINATVKRVASVGAGPTKSPAEVLAIYKQTLNDLVQQGYPYSAAEQAATKYTIGDYK